MTPLHQPELLIVFVKNITLGKVKTRLAKTIGNKGAFNVYTYLVELTEKATKKVKSEKCIYFSEVIIDAMWKETPKRVQKGHDLGEKMKNAFKEGFDKGFDKIILIGSDLPDISAQIIQKGYDKLANNEVVFGPAEDGGYYLIGMKKPHFSVFKNKQWSTTTLLEKTLLELKENNVSYSLLETLNDIDTEEDLTLSSINTAKILGLINP